MPIRDKVYDKLKSLGLTDSKEDFFKYYDSDENVRKDVYRRLREDGLRNSEEEFYSAMKPQQAMDEQIKAQSSNEPYTHVYDKDMNLVGGTAYQAPEYSMPKNSVGRPLPSLSEQVNAKVAKEGGMKFGKPGFVQDEATALHPMSGTSLADRLSNPRVLDENNNIRAVQEAEEEKEIDKTFVSKPMNTAKDVYDNYGARFTNTQRGIELGEELAAISKGVQDKYVKEYLSSDQYKALKEKYQGEELAKQANDQFALMYGEVIEKEMEPYQKAYNDELSLRYGSQMEGELNRINKEEAGVRLNELSASVDTELEAIEKRITDRTKAVRNDSWKPGMPSVRDDKGLAELRGQRTYLDGAKELIEESQKIINAANDAKDGTAVGGVLRGVRDKAFDIDTWTMGLSDLVGGMRLNNILEKVEKGDKLTPAEEMLFDASVNNMAINYYYQNDLGKGYMAGQITGESLPFMLEMIVNPISASGNAIAKRLLNAGLKKFAKKKSAQVGARLIGDATAALGMASTTGMPSIIGDTYRRMNENYNYGVDAEGNLYANKKADAMGIGEAFTRSFATRAIENQSEMIFNAFKGVGGFMKGVQDILPGGVNRFFDMLSHNKVADAYRWLKNSKVFRNYLVKDIRNATQIGGLGEEYLEEVYNNLANFAIGEMSWEDVTSLDKNIDTLLGLAPTQVMFGILGLGGAGAMRYQTRRTLEDLQATMNEQQRRELEGLLDMGIDAKETDVRGFIRSVMANQNYTIENKRDLIKAAYYVAKQKGIDEMAEADVVEKVNAEYSLIDSMTDPSTGTYAEVNRLVTNPETGEREAQPGYVVGWIGEGDKRQPIFVADGMENTYENRMVLKPTEWEKESYQEMPAEQVKTVSEEMIREEATQQAEQEAKYAPEVLNAQMQQGVPFDTPNAQIVPVAPMPEGNGWIVEEYALDTNNKVAKTPIVRELTNDEYRDMLQAQVEAQEAAATPMSPMESQESTPMTPMSTPMTENVQPVAEGVATEQQAPVIPTKEDGSIDFVSYGKEGTFKTLGDKYGEKMPNKVAVTAKALAEDLKKAQNKLQKAEEAYDNAPIGREQKAEEARDKAKQELEAIQREANFWAEMDAEIKDAQARRESMLNPQTEVETSTEPMNVDEFVAQQLASGNIILDKEDYKNETGYGDTEANAMNGGAIKLFGKNGMTIQEAGERLMEMDRENGTNFFDQSDPNAGRDALLSVLASVRSRKELNQYIAENRKSQSAKESEGLRNELEKQVVSANYASLEDYVLQMEAAEMENPFDGIDVAQIDAIFAEAEEEYQQYLNSLENGQGTTSEAAEGSDNVLPEEQSDNTGGTSGIESEGDSERNGEGTLEESEGTYEEGEDVKSPIRERAKDWENKLGVKVNLIESIDQVTNREALIAIQNGQRVTGWFEESTGEVCFYMPYLESENEVDSTYIHEVVAHKGLRGLLGDKFDAFCDEVWESMSVMDKAKFIAYPGVNSIKAETEEETIIKKRRAAADEYIAHLAENIDVTDSVWSQFTELIKKFLKAIGLEPKMTNADIANTIKRSYQRLLEGDTGSSLVGEGTRFSAKKISDRRKEINRLNNTVDQAVSLVTGKDIKEVKAERIEREQKRKEDAAEIYQSVLSGDFNDVTLQKINDYIDDATPLHPYGQRISQRLPQKLERGLHEGARTNAVDALFSRICESAVPASRRSSEAGRREIEERKKEALKGWAIATNNWHTDLSDFADEEDFIRQGTDSKVYLAKDGKHVIKVSFGKPEGKRFRPDIDTTALFNSVFRNTAYEIVGYGEFDGKFARILKQPFVDFADKTALNADEREEYMRTLGFEPINESRTAFSNGSIVAADLQKSNILKDAAGNISVIDADMKLHTKDVGGNYTYPPVEADLPEGKISFRVVNDKNGKKTLVGLHNISEAKLKKAIKQGGLANPSMAVIDMDKQSHVDYGDITLVAPAELIDKNTGRSAGTYMGDAWTPVYPKVTLQLDNKGWKKINQYIESIVEDRELQNNMKYGAEMYIEGENGMYMNFAFLKAKGLNPEIFYKNNDGYISTDDIKKLLGVEEIDTSFEGYSKLKDLPEETLEELKLWARTYGNKAKIDSHKKRLEEIKNQYGEDSKAYKLMAKPSDELGYGEFDRLVVDTKRKERDNGKIDSYKTFNEANYYVAQNGLRQEFENWMDELLLDAGAKEVFFAGYTPSGNKRYMANTIENVSKFMNKQSKTNAYDETGFGATKALFLKKLNTLEEIREQKDKLVELEEYRETTKELSDRMGDLISRLSDMQTISSNKFMNYDYAASRLQEAMTKRNPIKHLNDEYGYGLDKKGSFAEDLSELIKDIKDSPARYFETKFERPVYLSEFAAAVIPQGTSKDVMDALSEAGLPIEEYERDNNEARMAAVDKVSSEIDGVRFRFIGERGARNLDKAEEATTRLDNLAVAREMEAAEKDAKTIKMATGWERGADGLWRYEVDDNIDFELRRPKKAELKKAYEEANEQYYKLEMRVPTRTPKSATEEEKLRIKEMRKELAKLRKGMNKAFDAYYDYSAESATLGEFLGKDNQLFKEYPELVDYDVSFLRDSKKLSEGLKGSFTSEYKVIWIDDARPKGDIKSTLVHEIQHAIQGIEGFAQGGTPAAFASAKYQAEDWKKTFNDFINRYGFEDWSKNLPIEDWMKYGKEYKGQFGGLHRAFIDNAVEDEDVKKSLTKELDYVKAAYDKFYQIAGGMDAAYKFKDANEWYRSLSGEVESRNVQQRMGMTDEQRRNTLAESTEDVSREDQIFLKEAMEGQTMFRVVGEPAIDYVSQAEDVVEVPRDEVMYTMNNIANQLYKTSGRFMRQLYKHGTIGRVLKGEYAEIDQIKAKQEYDHAKPILEEYLNELVWMKYQATEAAQEVINDVISDVEYAMQYYKDLSLGKDVWRTNVSPRFRISGYGKHVKVEVDRVTSKYNGKEVMFFDSEMTDEEIGSIAPGYTAADLKPYFNEGTLGGYSSRLGKISIFADNNPVYDVEDTIFHENLHAFLSNNKDIVEAFADKALSRFPKNVKSLQEKGYSDEKLPEELLVRLTAKAMSYGIFDDVRYNLPEGEFEKLKEFLKHFGYDYREEVKSRSLEEGRRGTPTLLGGEEIHETRGVRQDTGEQTEEKRTRKEELGKLIDQVADMGLEGVLGNKEYTSAMVDIYKALPNEVRAELADDALRNYGGSIAPAVSDYLNVKADGSLWDKIVSIVREALRKVGFDIDLNGNEVRYLAWRSKKPIDRNNIMDMAEDIDKKYRLGVGEYSPTRFRVSKEKLEGFSRIYKDFKADNYGLPSYAQDAVESALEKMAEEMKSDFGDNAFDFFNNAGEILTNNWIKQYEKENPYFNGFYKYKDVIVKGNDDAQDLMDGILEFVPKNELEKEENIEKYIPSEVLDAVIVPNGKTIKFIDSEVMDILQHVTGKSKGEIIEDYGGEGLEMLNDEDFEALNGGGTRFSVKSKPKTKAELKEEVRDLKEDVKSLKDEVRDLKKQVNTLRSGNKDEWEKKQRAIVSFIKGRLTKEAGSVLGKTRLDQLLTLVNKASTATDLHKPLQFIEQVINDASIEHAAAKMDKLIKTKLQGETNRGVAKGVVVDEATRRLFDSIRGTFKDLIVTSIDSELRSVRGEILRFGKEINALPEDDIQGRAILTARQDALKERRKELEKEQEEIQRQNITDTKESLERRHDELVEAMDAHIESEGVWTQEMQDEYDSIPLRLKLAEIRESQSQLDAILADAIMTRRNAYQNTGETRKKMLAEADVLESNYTIAQEELIRLMNEVSDELNAIIKEGKSRLATRKQALAERRRAIVTMGISAVKDKKIKDPNAILTKKEKFDKWFDNSWMKSVSDFMTAPLNSFNFMLKYIDRNHTIGEGELYNHFMKSEEGALEANNRLYDGLKAYNTAIEKKAKEIFGKDIEAVMKDSGKEYTDKVHKQYMYDSSSHKEGEMYPISITKGQALYVWLTWRQDDGRAKLVADGWNDQSIEEIEALIGEDYIKFGEWITDEFFPMLREEKYNKTHIDMFGTSMAKREHYFPFKVQSEDIQEKGEMGESYSGMPSTITGNIIKRTINKSRIKTDQNAFDLLYKYGNDMEIWNAMAKLRQDLNFLHSSKAFRNYLEANSKGLFDKFMKAAEVAVKAYNNGEKDAINDFFAKLNRTWAGTNIGFRLNTAMKQILSYPAFMAYSGNLKYQGYLMKYMLNWVGNYKWAKENLPAFRNRVESGDMGMTGMTDPSFDLGKVINKFGEWGMIPNQSVDALTCAAGARSVYDFEYNRAIKAGMSEEEAKNIAQYNAEVAFNETQQSSRDEFVSPTQVSRNVLIKSMMNYQNSNVGYQRLGNEGLLEIMRAKHVYEQDIKNGMSEDEAKKKVANSVIRGTRKMMIAFTILPGLWYLGGRGIVGITAPLISSLFGGGDDDEPYLDDEAKEGLMLSMALGTVAGTSGGQAIASVVQGREYEPMAYVKEFSKIITDAVKDGFNLNTTKNIVLKMAKFGGVNVETFENIYIGVEHAIRTGNFDLVDFMFLINLPPSQRKKMAEELYSDMPFMEYAEKVSRAQKLFDDYRKNLPYAKGDKNGSKKNAIKKQYVIENLSNDKQDKLEKEKEFKKLQREYGNAEDKKEWIEEHPEYKELEKNFKSQEVTKEVNREAKKLK